MLVISSRISGWRVTDSMTLPKMMPMPTPAPTAPRPPPIPIPRPLPTAAKGRRNEVSTSDQLLDGLVMRYRATDVDGGKGGEDEGLQRGDQAELEQVQDDRERHREPAEEAQAEHDR